MSLVFLLKLILKSMSIGVQKISIELEKINGTPPSSEIYNMMMPLIFLSRKHNNICMTSVIQLKKMKRLLFKMKILWYAG